jgi:recombination protein RecA
MRKITGLVGREKVLLVFTNQVRTNPGVMYGDPFTTPGGHAIPFHSSVRVRMRSTKKIREKKDGIKQVVGVKIRPHVIKNRLGPPERHTEFDLYFNSGIDDFSSWWDVLKDHKILQHSSSGWYKVYDEDENGEKVPYVSEGKDKQMKIQEANFTKECQENPQFRKDMKRLLAKKLVVQYEDGWVDRSDVEYVDLDETDE